MNAIETAFQETTKLLFGKPLGPLDDYEEWLTRRIPKGTLTKSAVNGRPLYLPRHAIFKEIPKNAAAGMDSFSELSKRQLAIGDESLASLKPKLKDIAICIAEFAEGNNSDVIASAVYMDLLHAYKIVDCFHSKRIAYAFFSDHCESVFGTAKSFNCHFSINCYNSKFISRSFEVDFSKNCSDVMFCHNCDRMQDSLFCFNARNKKYAIANNEVGKEQYMETRAKLVERILESLEKKKYFEPDIYTIGCRRV
ncbi:MAG: hypothetical protein V1492_03545 [Candidatus Micrarchaeota archaeon]